MRPIEFIDSLSIERIEWEDNGSRFFAQAPYYTIYVLYGYKPPERYTPGSNLILEDVKQQVFREVSRRRSQGFVTTYTNYASAEIRTTQQGFHQEEVSAIARYMAGEMNKNAASPDVQRIRGLNEFGDRPFPNDTWWQDIANKMLIPQRLHASGAALIAWAWLVRTNDPWDHKPIIGKRFKRQGMKPDDIQADHLYIAPDGKEYAVYYDVWSNIHYGYVGMACGFSPDILLDGAGVEQIGTDLKAGHLPSRKGTQGGLRDLDDPDDSAAISIGIDIYNCSKRVRAEDLLNRVVTNPLFIRPRGTPKK